MKLLGIEVTLEEFDNLICEQNKGKELKVINGKVVAVERVVTEEQLNQIKLNELTNWFNYYFDRQLNQSLWQDDFKVSRDDYFNKDYANIDELKTQAKLVRDEIRKLRQN